MLSQSFEVLSWTAVPIGTIAPVVMIPKRWPVNRSQAARKTRPAIIVRVCALSQGEVSRGSLEEGYFCGADVTGGITAWLENPLAAMMAVRNRLENRSG